MILILAMFFAAKGYYRLAIRHDKKAYLYALLGVVMFYVAQFIGGALLGIGCIIVGVDFENIDEWIIQLISIPLGFGGCFLFYKYLERKWNNNTRPRSIDDSILDSELLDDNL